MKLEKCLILYRKIIEEYKEMCEYFPEGIIIEGGDIIIHNKYIFVGLNGNRTSVQAVDYLEKRFKGIFQVIKVNMITKDEWIHLDCILNPISDSEIILYKDGIDKKSFEVMQSLFKDIILINEDEANKLGANILSLGNKTIISQKRLVRLNNILKEKGYIIEIIDDYKTIELTGFVRCLSCPLLRDFD